MRVTIRVFTALVALVAVALAAIVAVNPSTTSAELIPCIVDGTTKLDNNIACKVVAGTHGAGNFDSAVLDADAQDLVYKTRDQPGYVVLHASNPNGGTGVMTTQLNGVDVDTFTIEVIRFAISEIALSQASAAPGDSVTMTVTLDNPSNIANTPRNKAGDQFARSWVQLEFDDGSNFTGSDFERGMVSDPIQVVAQWGKSVEFTIQVGAPDGHSNLAEVEISLSAYRQLPDKRCPLTEQPDSIYRCWLPPEPEVKIGYLVTSGASAMSVAAPPAAVTPTLSAAQNSLTASWTEPADNGREISAYEVSYRPSGGDWSVWATTDGEARSSTITGLDAGASYEVRLRAQNAVGWGPLSPTPAQITLPLPDPPAAVSAVNVTREDGALTASWDAVDNATSYHVTYTDDNAASWQLAALDHTGTSITINADNSKSYIVGVRAKNAGGGSNWVNSAAAGPFNPPPPNPPAAVASVNVARADGTVTASWDAPDGAAAYHITYRSNNTGGWQLAALNHPSNSITIAAVNSDTYIVAVRARNSVGDSAWRDSAPAGPFTPTPTQPPGSVSSVDLTRASGTVTATWGAATGATSYHVTYSSNGGQSWSLAAFSHTSTSITFAANDSATYIVGVRAKNAAGGSGWTNSAPIPASNP